MGENTGDIFYVLWFLEASTYVLSSNLVWWSVPMADGSFVEVRLGFFFEILLKVGQPLKFAVWSLKQSAFCRTATIFGALFGKVVFPTFDTVGIVGTIVTREAIRLTFKTLSWNRRLFLSFFDFNLGVK